MSLVYLPNGEMCNLVGEFGDKYIINKIYQVRDEYGEIIDYADDTNELLVPIIYKEQPISKFGDQVKVFKDQIKDLHSEKLDLDNQKKLIKKEISDLEREVNKLTATKITKNKFIVNLTELLNAKKIVVFIDLKIMPVIYLSTDKNFNQLKLSINIEVGSGIERSWVYKIYYEDGGYSSGDYICPKYKYLINPTDEEVDAIIRERVSKTDFNDHQIISTDSKYLTDELIAFKNNYITNKKTTELKKLEGDLVVTQRKINNLKNEL